MHHSDDLNVKGCILPVEEVISQPSPSFENYMERGKCVSCTNEVGYREIRAKRDIFFLGQHMACQKNSKRPNG